MSNREVESLVEGRGGLASRRPNLVFLGLFREMPHSCLEYGTWVTGWKKYLVHLSLWSSSMWKSLTWLTFSYVNKRYFLLWSMRKCIDYDGDIMVEFPWFICWLLLVYMLVISWLYVGYMRYIVYVYWRVWWICDWLLNTWHNICYCI